MKKFHMIIDLEKCVGCFNCMLACKDEFVGNKWLPYTDEQQKHEDKWICPTLTERGEAPYTEVTYVTKTCMHCDNAPCIKKYPDIFFRRSDGIVLIDPQRAKGNPDIVNACPYGNIHWNEELQTAQKCIGCAHLLDQGWTETRCVQACPLHALQTVFCEDYQWDKLIETQGLRPITGGENRPRVMYKNLYCYDKCFIKGAFAFDKESIEEAAIDVKVELLINKVVVAETKTDYLGEFKIDRIPKNSGPMTIRATMEGYDPILVDLEIADKSVVLDCYKFGTDELGKPAVIVPNDHANELALQHMTKADAEETKKAYK